MSPTIINLLRTGGEYLKEKTTIAYHYPTFNFSKIGHFFLSFSMLVRIPTVKFCELLKQKLLQLDVLPVVLTNSVKALGGD